MGVSVSEMTNFVSGGALNSTHLLHFTVFIVRPRNSVA